MVPQSQKRTGFSLIEILVCTTIVSTVLAVSVPTIYYTQEKARRTICSNNIRTFMLTLHMYTDNHHGRLPSGASNAGPDREHTPVISTKTYQNLLNLSAEKSSLVCPWVGGPFEGNKPWIYEGYGYVLGYNYLGGHQKTPWPRSRMVTADWRSPQTTTAAPSLALVTELNAWTEGEGRTWAPHGKRGGITQYSEINTGGITSKQAGATGGNIGRLDGSVFWRDIKNMNIYQASQREGAEGCVSYW